MEGFVHPTKAQKLAAMKATLQRAYAKESSISKKLYEDLLRQIEQTETSEERRRDAAR